MPKYTLSSGEKFETVILPKGTVLFRGMDLYTDKPHPEYIFTDLFGSQDEDGYYCTDPYENKFFYPAPLVSDSVNRYSIHSIYITNYDLEIILLLLPSELSRSSRGTANSPVLRCSDISDKDSCGKSRKPYDPCLSPMILKEFPFIQGYIAIAEKDTRIFQKGQVPALMNNVPGAVDIVQPFIVANSRKIQGIPEIVLFPYHTRSENMYEKSIIHPRAVEPDYIAYAISNRAKLNYFPLVYVTEEGFFSFYGLLNKKNLNLLSNSMRDNPNFDSQLVKNMIWLITSALDPKGFDIGTTTYKFTIDVRSGFYVMDIPDIRRLNYTIRNINVKSTVKNKSYVVPFHYPYELKKRLHSSFTKTMSEEALESRLNRLYGSYSKSYQFNKGDPATFKTVYKMEMATPRPELNVPSKRYTRKIKKT